MAFANDGQANRRCLSVAGTNTTCGSIGSKAKSSFGVALGNVDGDGSIRVVKRTDPEDPQDFPFAFIDPHDRRLPKGPDTTTFKLDDDPVSALGAEQKGDVLAGTYTITESKVAKWVTTDITCNDPSGGTTVDSTQQQATIDLAKGEVVTCTFVNEHPSRDYGDAPDTVTRQRYPTLKSHNGASHHVQKGFYLGTTVDVDRDGLPSVDAKGDNNNGTNDENGVPFTSTPLVAGQTTDVKVVASQSGGLDAWIDYNGDNTWQASEALVKRARLRSGSNRFRFKVPSKTSEKKTVARFRLSEGGGLPPTGPAGAGEVEDYQVEIVKGASSPASVTATPGSEGVELEWSASESEDVMRYRIYRDTTPIDSSTSPSALSPYDSTGAEETNYVDTDVQSGQTYYYRVTAVDETGLESPVFSEQARAFLYPEEVTVEANRSFGGASDAEDYRLVALPGQVDRPLAETASGEPKTDWQAFWDDGSSENFLLKFDGSEIFTFRPGRGFWLTHVEEWAVEASVPTVQLRGDSAATIDLHEGWNIVSNPTDKDVAWAHVAAENGGDLQPLWAFDGSFAQADTFRSARAGVAYYFQNNGGLDSLTVPYPGSPPETAGKRTDERTAKLQVFTLTATLPSKGTSSSVRLGTATKAERGKDSFDVLAPPIRFSTVSLRLQAPTAAREEGTRARQRHWARDVRPTSTDGRRYRFHLHGPPGSTVRLTASGLEQRSDREVALLDPGQKRSWDLSPDDAVELTLRDSSRVLRLALGTEAYVRNQKEAVRPDKVTLTSYPNPIRGQGTLVYTLPKQTEVRLVLYDLLGREVTVLAEGRKEAGRHRVPLNASQLSGLSSGVYFGRLKAAGKTRTHKITVVR